jgi:hypothetical protein
MKCLKTMTEEGEKEGEKNQKAIQVRRVWKHCSPRLKSDSESVVRFPVRAVTPQKKGESLGALHQRHNTAESEVGHPLTEISHSGRNIVALMTIVTDKTQDTDTARCPRAANIDVGVFLFQTFVSLQALNIIG